MIETKDTLKIGDLFLKLVLYFSIRCSQNVISSLISTQQTAYIKNRFIGEGGILLSDTVNIYDRNNIGEHLVTIDIGSVLDSLDNKFILVVLKKFVFGKNFVSWVEAL